MNWSSLCFGFCHGKFHRASLFGEILQNKLLGIRLLAGDRTSGGELLKPGHYAGCRAIVVEEGEAEAEL
jgi:hypothetical protein